MLVSCTNAVMVDLIQPAAQGCAYLTLEEDTCILKK